MANKKIDIDWAKVDKCLKAAASLNQTAIAIGVSDKTLKRRIKEEFNIAPVMYKQQCKEQGDLLLSQSQYDIALTGSIPMLIWLGKQRLGQTDKQEVKQDIKTPFTGLTIISTGIKPIRSEAEMIKKMKKNG